jgi:hypothetical protein
MESVNRKQDFTDAVIDEATLQEVYEPKLLEKLDEEEQWVKL